MSIVTVSRFAADLREVCRNKLRLLGASVGVNYCCRDVGPDGIQEVQSLFISCAREAWVEEFGEPQQVRKDFDPHSGRWQHEWQHPLSNGRVRCVGDFFRRSSGREWIIVRQMGALEVVGIPQ